MSSTCFGFDREEKLEVTDQTLLKCYRCFSKDIKYVCHHCGRYICAKCEPRAVYWLRRLKLYPFLFKDYQFFDLYPLEKHFQISTHCQEHIHYRETVINLLIWLIIGTGLISLGLAWVLGASSSLAFGLGLILILAGVILLGMRGSIYRLMLGQQLDETCILFPRYKIEVTERLGINFTISNNPEKYLCVNPRPTENNGKIIINLQLTSDDCIRCKDFISRKDRKTVRFSAGYLGLDNLSQVSFAGRQPNMSFDTRLSLKGSSPINHAGRLHLAGETPAMDFGALFHGTTSIKVEQDYTFLEKTGWLGAKFDQEFLFWIMPDLSLAGKELNLFIYVAVDLNQTLKLEQLCLDVSMLRDYVTETDGLFDKMNGVVEWAFPHLNSGVNRVFIRFSQPLQQDLILKGSYQISARGFLLSKLKLKSTGQLWLANGELAKGRHANPLSSVEVKTLFAGEIRLETNVFKLQKEFICETRGEKPGRRPDHGIICQIAEGLTQQGVEIKSIIETPARIGNIRDNARLWDRYWEINGRHYLIERLQYVEVHLVVYGQENQADPENYEYLRWQLHLRSGLPLHNLMIKECIETSGPNEALHSSKLEKQLGDLRDVLGREIERQLC